MKQHHLADHAVVIGASMAGLLAARVLSDHVTTVTVVDRDDLPDGPGARKGVPQSRHLHAFWAGGLSAVETLLPGMRADLVAAGAVPVAMPTDMAWLTPADRWAQAFPATQEMMSASRPLLEWAVRRRVRTRHNVHFLTGQDVTGLALERGEVRGVDVRDRRCADVLHLTADLVVDASGRNSRLPDWLAAHGLPTPEESQVDAFLGYATRSFHIPPGVDRAWRAVFVQNAPPRHPRGGIMFPIEGDRWLVTLMGGGRDYPPTDEPGFLAFARSLRSPLLHDAIVDAEPTSPIWGYRRTSNRRRHYERIRMPNGLLALGDSLCAFNPVYGQGMTVAAKEAVTLERLLAACRTTEDLPAVVRRAQRDLAACANGAWTLSTSSDLRYPETEGARLTVGTRIVNRYMNRVVARAADDPAVNAAFLRVLNMVDRPEALFGPGIASRVLVPRRTRPGRTAPGAGTERASREGVA